MALEKRLNRRSLFCVTRDGAALILMNGKSQQFRLRVSEATYAKLSGATAF
jgi:hypothetical protein